MYTFDAKRAYEHVKTLCYPRRAGTRHERRAARYIRREFAALGLEGKREPFRVSHFATEIGSRGVFALCGLLVLLGALLATRWPLVSACCWGLAGLFVNSPWRLEGLLPSHWPPWSRSENVLATPPEQADHSPARVVFMAHYDTKSQLLPTGCRVFLVCLTVALCGALVLLGLAAAAGRPAPSHTAISWAVSAVVLVSLAGLVANVTGNRSCGAVDNGSAVGTLLELARCWQPRSEMPVEVVWVATGSEEVALDGARHFLRLHASWWQEKPTLLINLESVGTGSRVYLSGERHSLELARQIATQLGLRHARLRVLGAGMDHEPFAALGLASVSILGDVVRTSFALHSTRDNLNLIEHPALDRAGRLAACLAWRWAEMHQPGPVCRA
jgi:hypothetical protein